MAEEFLGDVLKSMGSITDDVGEIIAPSGIGEALTPAIESISKATQGLGDSLNASGLLNSINDQFDSFMDPHVEMIDETLETPDGTIVAYSDHDFDDDSGESSSAAHDDSSASDVAEA